jgi:hypothetical protein|tara:strand:- start:202 stop:435 length:234 start_codon:yes stop_codon:yes gene_type:complete
MKDKGNIGKVYFNLDLNLRDLDNKEYLIEITENYEDDKFHVVVFETEQTPNEHYATLGFDTEKQVYDYLKKLQNQQQ